MRAIFNEIGDILTNMATECRILFLAFAILSVFATVLDHVVLDVIFLISLVSSFILIYVKWGWRYLISFNIMFLSLDIILYPFDWTTFCDIGFILLSILLYYYKNKRI